MQVLNIKEYFEIQIELFYEICVCFWSVLIATSPLIFIQLEELLLDNFQQALHYQYRMAY